MRTGQTIILDFALAVPGMVLISGGSGVGESIARQIVIVTRRWQQNFRRAVDRIAPFSSLSSRRLHANFDAA
jgi:hypothetical protein